MKNEGLRRWFAIAAIGSLGLAACENTPVELPEATSLRVSPASMTLFTGEFSGVSAQVLDQDGRVMRGVEAEWSSSAPGVATVENGLVRGVAPGTATLQATYGQNTATVEVTVSEDTNEAASVDVLAEDMELHVLAGSRTVSYRVTDVRGRSGCSGETAVEVTSSDESILEAWASSCGRIVIDPRFNGTATVAVTVDGVSDSFDVTVVSNRFAAFWAEQPEAGEFVAGETVEYTVRVLDQENQGVEGHTVHFSATRGGLESTAAVTDADGYATATWNLPESLRGGSGIAGAQDVGSIWFSTALPSGEEADGQDTQAINPAAPVAITWFVYDWDLGTWTEVDATFTAETGETIYVYAQPEDEFGNERTAADVDYVFEPEDAASFSVVEGSYYAYASSSTAQTVTVTAYDTDGDGLDVDTDFSDAFELIWEDPAAAN